MRLALTVALCACSALWAEDPWIGTWQVVWASASYDNLNRMTISKHSDHLRLAVPRGGTQALRSVDPRTAEFAGENKGEKFLLRYAAGEGGQELAVHNIHSTHDHVFVYDRVDGSVDPANPLVGVWISNSAKTQVRQQEPRTYEAADNGAFRFRGVGTKYTAAFDGKDHTFAGSTDSARQVALRRIDDRTFEETFKDAGGKILNVRRVAVSADGSEMTFTHSGTFPQGQGHRVLIFRRKR